MLRDVALRKGAILSGRLDRASAVRCSSLTTGVPGASLNDVLLAEVRLGSSPSGLDAARVGVMSDGMKKSMGWVGAAKWAGCALR